MIETVTVTGNFGLVSKKLELPKSQPDYVNVLVFKDTVHGVFSEYEEALSEAVRLFGEDSLTFLDAIVIQHKLQ